MTVVWSATAQFRLEEIYSWIAADDKEAAARWIARIIDRADQIATFSMSGRVVPEFNMPQIREVMEGPYRIIYHISADRIEVLTVLHSSQDIQTMLSVED